ncbi:hypothetical protein T484DRAFT_1968899 [Baffinella frigidus]|nr:hypothetical protein T484DRAFT_1968899 [Cryptophyta sp. CCMP2293]
MLLGIGHAHRLGLWWTAPPPAGFARKPPGRLHRICGQHKLLPRDSWGGRSTAQRAWHHSWECVGRDLAKRLCSQRATPA